MKFTVTLSRRLFNRLAIHAKQTGRRKSAVVASLVGTQIMRKADEDPRPRR